MAESSPAFEKIEYRRVFPWLHLFRAAGLALRVRLLILGAVGALLGSGGSAVIDSLPFSRTRGAVEQAARWPWEQTLGYTLTTAPTERWGAIPGANAWNDPAMLLRQALGNWQLVLRPVCDVAEPAAVLFNSRATWPQLADAALRTLWMLLVWSIVGGAMARIAALEFAREQRLGIPAALRFSAARLPGYCGAPLLPLLGIALLAALCMVGGWASRIPGGVGPAILGALWGLELLFGLMMAVLLLGVAVGWPLMFAAISVQGTDGYDGLSRAYSYVLERPVYLVWQLLLFLLQGSVCAFLVWSMARLVVVLAAWGVSWGSGGVAGIEALLAGSPELLLGAAASPAPPKSLGASIAQGWMALWATLVVGYVYSYFWTGATMIYFVLRRSVDANDFDEVGVDDAPETDELLPLVGQAAMQQPAVPPANDAPAVDLTP